MCKVIKLIKFLFKFPLWGLGGFFFFLGMGGNVSAQNLEDYLKIAAENNAGLQAAYAEFEAALQQAPQVKSLPDPTLTVTAFGSMVETRLGPQEARFSLMQMFPWFGTLSAKEDAATLMAEAKFQAYLDARNELFYKVSEQYFRLYELEKQLQFQKDNEKILQNYKDLALAQVRSGNGAMADVLQTDLMVEETRTTTEILELQKKPLQTLFNMLLNREKEISVEIPDTLEVISSTLEHAPVSFEDHPRIVEVEKRLSAASFQEEVARKEGMPNVGLGIDYVIIGERMDMAVDNSGQDALMPMLSVSLPIFRKKYKAAQKEARFMQESYAHRKEEVENALSSEYEEVVFEIEKSRKMLQLYRKQIENTNRILNLQLSSYRSAGAGFEEVLRIRQELLRYQLEIAGAEKEYFTAVARKNYITGNF
jgi:outer membrane protein TolC